MLLTVGVTVGVKVFVQAGLTVSVSVGVFEGPPAPAKLITHCAGMLYVNELADTGTADCATRLLLASVSHGVTVVAESPLRLNCWLTDDELELMTTIANLPDTGSWYAEHSSPDVGAAVASMRT